ncbi:MAG: hypothetical protein J4432_04645 [DPANN group archaeon]|nr:hypothetical protein [DPANN group archaeon]
MPNSQSPAAGQGNIADTVLQMLRDKTPKQQIVSTLRQMNIAEQDALQIFETANARFREMEEAETSKIVSKEMLKKERVLTEYVDKTIDSSKKDLALQADLKFLEQKKYVDKQRGEMADEVNRLNSELFAFKMDANYKLEQLNDDVNKIRLRGSTKNMISLAIIILGIMMIMYSLGSIVDILKISLQIVPFVTQIVLAMIGALLIKIGVDVYLVGRLRTFKEYGLDWLAPKEKETEV